MTLYSDLQWADTAFPSGRYTLSHGLEGMAALGTVTKEDYDSLLRVSSEMVLYSLAPVDLTAHFRTFEATDLATIKRIDTTVSAARATSSQRLGSVRVGKQMLFIAGQLGLHDETLTAYHDAVQEKRTDGNQAVAAALIHRARGQNARESAVVEAFGFVASLASAAVRLQLADFISAQQLITDLSPAVDEAIDTAISTSISQIGACIPLADVAAARHETAEARLFIT